MTTERRRALVQAALVWLVVQVLAIAAGITAARLSGSSVTGLWVSNVGAVLAVLAAMRYYLAAVR